MLVSWKSNLILLLVMHYPVTSRACWLMYYANNCQFSNWIINLGTRLTGKCLLNHSCKRERKNTHITSCYMHSLRIVCVQRCSSCQVFLRRAQSLLRSACLGLLRGWRRSLHLWRIWQRLPSLFEMWQIEMYCKNTLAEQVFYSLCRVCASV